MVAYFGQKRVQVFRQNKKKNLHAFLSTHFSKKKVNFPLLSFSTHFYLFISQTSSSDGFHAFLPFLKEIIKKIVEKCVEAKVS